MTLPDYFLADLPSGATLTGAMLTEACQTLRRNRAQYLAERSTASLIDRIVEVAQQWLNPAYHLRRLALEQGPAATGFSAPTLEAGLDALFESFTPAALEALVAQDLGMVTRLDAPGATELEAQEQRAAMALGPELVLHLTGGPLPNPVVTSVVLGLLARAAQCVKCARGTAFLPRLFAHSIYEADAKLGACLEVAEWPGGQGGLDDAVFAAVDAVTVTGSDETVNAVRRRLPPGVRLVEHGHRVSFAYVARECLAGGAARRLAAAATDDVVAWDQRGCLSPQVLYAEKGGAVAPGEFAAAIAAELDRREPRQPRGPVGPEIAAAIATRRHFYEVRAAYGADTRLWSSAGSTAWTVVFENDPQFLASCGHRFLYVKAVDNLAQVLQGADAVRHQVSTVGWAVPERQAAARAMELVRWGVPRICPLGRMQRPPLTWRHDGRPALGELVSWADWER